MTAKLSQLTGLSEEDFTELQANFRSEVYHLAKRKSIPYQCELLRRDSERAYRNVELMLNELRNYIMARRLKG